MVTGILTKIFGTKSERDLKRLKPILEAINLNYAEFHRLSDQQLRYKTEEFKQKLAEGEPLDSILPEAFAVIKETSRRLLGIGWEVCEIETVWNMVPFDVQLMGAIVLHQGKIAEMATGEGKTLVATMPLYLNALAGKGVHLVTVNDYLAKRDAQWMGKLYELMGLSVGCIQHDMPHSERKEAYRCDVTYGTNNEFGFDYLRDNMATHIEERVQRGHHYAIVDEVDSILIDEARTPLIISGPVVAGKNKFESIKPAVERLAREQVRLVNNMISESEHLLEDRDEERAGTLLLAASRGSPKNKKLIQMMHNGRIRKLIERVEHDFMLAKRMREIDEMLYFAIDEKGNIVDLSEKGRAFLEKSTSWTPSYARSRLERPEIHIVTIDGSIDFSSKTKKVLLEDSTVDYLAHQIYPKIIQSDAGKDSLFLLPDSATAFQRIDSEAKGIMKAVILSEIKKDDIKDCDHRSLEEFIDDWLDANLGMVTSVQTRLRAIFEQDYTERSDYLHSISQLLRAYSLFEKDVDYVVKDDKVIIVDEFTGRLMPGRRYSDGLHQALEAKEGVRVEGETQTFATITIQNYFRLYEKLAGMTGTAETEAGEFWQIYKLDVVVVPTNEPVRRVDYEDVIFLTKREKYNAIIDEIARMHEKGRPVLVGTVSVEVSEILSRLLRRKGIDHSVLNAKYHEQEARIVARAGEKGAVTIATNMAGRGTDIKLGEGVVLCDTCCYKCSTNRCGDCPKMENTSEKCVKDMPCGLHIIGTERHESRRIDRQLRGRSGRQGDPGSSRFYLSLEDDLMRLFGSDRIAGVISRLGIREGEAIQHRLITRQIERAQKRVEANNFAIRKHLLEYDDVMNKQREVIYGKRLLALESENIGDEITTMLESFVERKIEAHVPEGSHRDDWNIKALERELEAVFLRKFDISSQGFDDRQSMIEFIKNKAVEAYEDRKGEIGYETFSGVEKGVLLYVIDKHWRDHLYDLDGLKAGIGLRAYGQRDPLIEYKAEAFDLFVKMLESIEDEVILLLFHGRFVTAEDPRQLPISAVKPDARVSKAKIQGKMTAPRAVSPHVKKVGRNDPCPCGSGKKYKKCCGK